MIRKLSLGLLLLALLLGNLLSTSAQESYWPTTNWRISTPEEQGINSDQLVHMLRYVQSEDLNINSILLIRHGYVVLDASIAPYSPGEQHIIHSATKSFTSTLLGIAMQDGLIDSLETPVSALLPDWTPSATDENKQAMTLQDLLTMQSGLDCHDAPENGWRDLVRMRQSSDWVQFMADIPMAAAPGTVFNYCNGITYLIGQIVSAQTGTPLLDYAQERLLGPLGISNYTWLTDEATGNEISWGGLMMTAPDMAKLGYLMLHNGEWDGQQIVSPEWVAAATTRHADGWYGVGYGYQWWVEENPDYYSARGFAGQYILVVPQQDLIVVFLSGLSLNTYQIPLTILESFILEAVQSDEPLPANPDSNAELAVVLAELSDPAPQPVPALPDMAQAISGTTYSVTQNSYGISTMALQFEEGADVMTLALGFQGQPVALPLPVGLDGVYRVTPLPGEGSFALRGSWTNDNTFSISLKTMTDPADLVLRMQFTDSNTLSMILREAVTGNVEHVNGQVE